MLNNKPKLFDEKSALDALSGDRRLLSELAIMFVEDAPILLKELETACTIHDSRIAVRTLHNLRGSSSTFFSGEIIGIAHRLESDLSDGDFDSLAKGMETLRYSVERLIQAFQELGYTQ